MKMTGGTVPQTSHIYMEFTGIYDGVMLGAVYVCVVCMALGCCALFLWYFTFSRKSKRRALEALGWIESLIAGQGHVTGISWRGSSSFRAQLHLRSNAFHNANLQVNLIPRERPLRWLSSKLKNVQETVIFEADLDWAPTFSLELQSCRMFARTRKDLSPEGEGWQFEQSTPFILTTRKDWQKEITAVISNLVGSPERQFLSIAFRRQSPHFCATLAIDALAPASSCRTEIFDSLRELATGASAPQI